MKDYFETVITFSFSVDMINFDIGATSNVLAVCIKCMIFILFIFYTNICEQVLSFTLETYTFFFFNKVNFSSANRH